MSSDKSQETFLGTVINNLKNSFPGKQKSQRQVLKRNYKNLLRLIDRVDDLKPRHLTNPHKYKEIFDDEDFLRGLFHEVDGTGNYNDILLDSSGSSLDYLLTMRKSVLPYVHYDIYELKNSHIKELGKERFSSFLHSVGLDAFPFTNPKKVHHSDAFEFILDKDEANKVVDIYNGEGYSDLLSIKDALREELVFLNKSIYANAGAYINNLISDSSNLTIEKRVEILKKIFSWLFGRPVKHSGYRFMYEYNSELLGICGLDDRSEISRVNLERIVELKKEGAIIYFKLMLLDYLLKERIHGRMPEDISSFLIHYEKQKDSTDRRGAHMKERVVIPFPKFWEEAKKVYEDKGEEWCMSSAGTEFPSGDMKENLANKDLFGYLKKEKELPPEEREKIPLKEPKIRELLGENHSKWKQ